MSDGSVNITLVPELEQLRRLTEIGRAFTYTTSLEQVERLTVERGAALLAASASVLMLADTEGLLHLRAVHQVPEERLADAHAAGADVVDRLPELLAIPEDRLLAVPLVVAGSVTGLLAVAELALEVAKLAKEYNDALVAVERNNHGAGVLAHLTSGCQYPNVYEQGGQQGWLTSTLTRPKMIGDMDAALVASPETFRSERLLRECRTFVRHRNGKMAAQSGEHDDCVMAMALALQVRAELVSKPRKRAGAA